MKKQMGVVKGNEGTFDTNAQGYAKMRPGYPDALYEAIFRILPLGKDSNTLEIGIGGGQATLPILKTGCRVTACDIGENFVRFANEKFSEHPFTAVKCGFEEFEAERKL